MLYDDRPNFPGSCFLRLQFQGVLDCDLFEAAVTEVSQDHPLLTATVKKGRGELWEFKKEATPKIVWISQETGGAFPPAQPIDLTQAPGLIIHVVQSDSAVDVTFQFHHACCDGAGIDRFASDLFIAYSFKKGGSLPASRNRPADTQRIASRGTYGLSVRDRLRLLPGQIVGMLGIAQFLQRRPQPLVAHQASEVAKLPLEHFPNHVGQRLTSELTTQLRGLAADCQVSLNDLLIRDFYLALWDWQRRRGEFRPDHWMRIMIPMNVRDKSWRSLPSMNFASSVFLDRRAADVVDANQLLQSIRHEMQVIHKFNLRFTFLLTLKILNWIPGSIKRTVAQDRCKTTAVFSNLGKLFLHSKIPKIDGLLHAGNLTLVDIDGLAPIRLYNSVTMFVFQYAGRLKFNLHYDPRLHTREDVEELLTDYIKKLASNVASMDHQG